MHDPPGRLGCQHVNCRRKHKSKNRRKGRSFHVLYTRPLGDTAASRYDHHSISVVLYNPQKICFSSCKDATRLYLSSRPFFSPQCTTHPLPPLRSEVNFNFSSSARPSPDSARPSSLSALISTDPSPQKETKTPRPCFTLPPKSKQANKKRIRSGIRAI
jgi:hypothetical protein